MDWSDRVAVRVVLDLPEEEALVRSWSWRTLHERPEKIPDWVFNRPPTFFMREPEVVPRRPTAMRPLLEVRGLVHNGMEDTAREWLWPEY